MRFKRELVAASSGPLVLSLLTQGPGYGYALIRAIHERSKEQIKWTEGMLYPVLHRLERAGMAESFWGESDSGRKRKYYRITDKGRRELTRQREAWLVLSSALARGGS